MSKTHNFKKGKNCMKRKNAAKWTRQHAGKKYHKAEYVQRHLCFVNVLSSLHENVVFFVRMGNAA